MNLMYYVMGKSASGKDTIFYKIVNILNLTPYIEYTTRPMREGEENGREYYFKSESQFMEMAANGNMAESRCYHVFLPNGQQKNWRYGTAIDDQIVTTGNLISKGTLESYTNLCHSTITNFVKLIPIYLEVPDHIRYQRALERENKQASPNLIELERRFKADTIDFSESKLRNANIHKRFVNNNLEQCINEICTYIRSFENI